MTAQTIRALSLAGLLGLSQAVAASAMGCPAYDSNGAAYIFSAHGDYSLSTSNATALELASSSSSARPTFAGNSTQCFTNQFTNGLYVLEDNANNVSVHIFDFVSQSWSIQETTGGPSSAPISILDHDTTVLYGYLNGTLYALSFDQSAAKATSQPLTWLNGAANNAIPFPADGYTPVLGAANNHIQLLNTPNSSAGQAYIFVIHYAYWQPEVQSFGDFPVSPGQTVTIFSNSSAAPATFAYIPDGGNNSYVIDAKTNTTIAFPAPASTDPQARYAASTTELLQLTPNGTLAISDMTAASGTPWSSINVTLPAGNMTSTNSSATAGVGSAGSESGSSAPAAGTTGSAVAKFGVPALAGLAAVLLLIATEQLL